MKRQLKDIIQAIPDFPKPGVLFRDITPVLADPVMSAFVVDELALTLRQRKIDAIAGIESRGFLFGMGLAQLLNVVFLPVRKPGKLPREVAGIFYDLEYGKDRLEIHRDDIFTGMRVHVHDDLLATGGTAEASAKLIEECGGIVDSFSFVIELGELNGRKKLQARADFLTSLVIY